MRKCPWFLCLLLVLISCDVGYVDNKRLFITGTLLDEDELPIANVSVSIFVPISVGIKGGMGREILGEGKTNTEGYFEFVTLAPKQSNTIIAEINEPFTGAFKQEFGSFSLQGIEKLEGQNADIRLQNLRLQRIVNTRFTIRRTSNFTDSILYRLQIPPIERISYLDIALIPETIPDFFFATDTLMPSQNEASAAIGPLLAQDTLQLDYRLSGIPNAEVISKKLVYNPETDSYVFEL